MIRRNLILLSVVMFGLVLGGLLWWFMAGQGEPTSTPQPRTSGKYTLFDGTIKNINRACDFDGQCAFTVDDKIVVTGGGLGPTPEDNIFGTIDRDLKIGEKVTVKALKADDRYTLRRCGECYVKRASN
jgi:hypothetical protein